MADEDAFDTELDSWLIQTFEKKEKEVRYDHRGVAPLGVEPTANVLRAIFDLHADFQLNQGKDPSDTRAHLEKESMDHVLALAWDLDKAYGGTRHQEMERPDLHHWDPEHDQRVYADSTESGDEVDAMDIDTFEVTVCSRGDTGSQKAQS
ncbi:hypothetical protein I302_104775 [Kwoniella bestiolae CBS 10118]|uniref:Uncharacterized protein n=1 Tax=Kwoniella bestiolae CBS 10118 TaxID=1296100 RepID=A0A1B9FRS7_9TREE|nr:hypothetical protein I302_09156 [Kwoniella bestiolae CBS 10118]OCF21477.1 hypothetical protein I302_09156 [Kwoniella bestiolae CBS 10118]